mmetsp:Transcript_20972/g.55553  ORF Transcript_20972/g.55553 Transcript_20972/m.55553 type:complete len:225 (-) Transcript_20972:70-744(-)
MQERNTLRDDFRVKETEYRTYMDEVRVERQRKYVEEREASNKEYDLVRRQRAVEKLDEQPFVSEITLIEQTMAFCKTLTATKGGEEKKEVKETVFDNPEDTVVLKKKGGDEEEFMFPTKGKKAKGRRPGESGKAKAKPIKHNAETFKLFDQLKLDAPITTSDIPALMEKLQAQLEEYNGKVKQWEEKREDMKRKILEEGFDPASEEKKEAEEERKEGAAAPAEE